MKYLIYLLTALILCITSVLSGQNYPLSEDFSGGVPPTGWSIENPDGSEAWEVVNTTQSDGTAGNMARMDNYSYNAPGQQDRLVLPLLDLSGVADPVMVFDVAYARFNASNFERLHIEYSTDGGTVFLPTTYDKSSADLATVSDQANGWGPQVAGDWRSETLDLAPYAGPSLILRFVQTNGYGNGLFIDNVVVNSLAALPVELLDFSGQATDKANLLSWSTAREEGFSHYAVERSPDGVSGWEQLGAVAGAGNVEEEQAYRFTDNQPLPLAYYRLRNVDLDGSHSYSDVILLERAETGTLRVHPNPSNGRFLVDLPLTEAQSAILRMFDAGGRQLMETQVSGQQYSTRADFQPGVYLLVVDTKSERWARRVTILR